MLELRRLWAHLWQFAQTSSVYEPAIVLYVVVVTQVENPAWSSYLENSLNFGDSDLGVLEILGNFMEKGGWDWGWGSTPQNLPPPSPL